MCMFCYDHHFSWSCYKPWQTWESGINNQCDWTISRSHSTDGNTFVASTFSNFWRFVFDFSCVAPLRSSKLFKEHFKSFPSLNLEEKQAVELFSNLFRTRRSSCPPRLLVIVLSTSIPAIKMAGYYYKNNPSNTPYQLDIRQERWTIRK